MNLTKFNTSNLSKKELIFTNGGGETEPIEGSYSFGYAVGTFIKAVFTNFKWVGVA